MPWQLQLPSLPVAHWMMRIHSVNCVSGWTPSIDLLTIISLKTQSTRHMAPENQAGR